MKSIKNWILNNKFLIATIIMFFFHPFFASFVMIPILFILFIDNQAKKQGKKLAIEKQHAIEKYEKNSEIELTYIKGLDNYEYGVPITFKINQDNSFSIFQDAKIITKKIESIYYLRFFDYKVKSEDENYEAEKDKEYVIFRMRDSKEFMFRLDKVYCHFLLSEFMTKYGVKEDSGVISL